MRISIITCTYNSILYLPQSVSSVVSQGYDNLEYIFVDGGSTDGTLDIIRGVPIEYKLLEGVRGGISAAMNAGLRAATGDVIAHLHSDDYYFHGQVLTNVSNFLQSSGKDWLFGRIMVDKNGIITPEGYAVPEYSYKRILKGNFIPHPATFVKKMLFDKAGYFDEKIKYAMDYDMWLRLGKISAPLQVDEHMTVFRDHDGSMSSANRLAALKEDFKVRMKHVGYSPFAFTYHLAHYLVRRERIRRGLRRQ